MKKSQGADQNIELSVHDIKKSYEERFTKDNKTTANLKEAEEIIIKANT